MATITITEALKYVTSIKKAISSEKHLENYKNALLNRSFTVTTAMSKERYNELMSDTSLTEEAIKAYEIMAKAIAIMETLKTDINKKNIEIGIDEKMLEQSLFKYEVSQYSTLITKLKESTPSYKTNVVFSYEEVMAQFTEEKKTVSCDKLPVSTSLIDTYKRLQKEAEKEIVRLGNEIAALNHTTSIEIDDEDLKFIEEFC